MKLTKQQRDKLWGDRGPYSQVQQIIETRILDDSVSRQFVIVSVNLNPLTYETVKDHREEFLDDREILGILDHAHYQGQEDGYAVYTYNDQLRGTEQLVIAQERMEITRQAVIKMHRFMMEKLGMDAQTGRSKSEISQPKLHDIFDAYLFEQERHLAPSTFSRYKDAIGLFEDCCNNYGHLSLDADLQEQLVQIEEGEIDFCDLLGQDVLHEMLFGEFLGYFLPRKVLCGGEMSKQYAVAIIHFYGWCCEKGYIQDEHVQETQKALREVFKDASKLSHDLASNATSAATSFRGKIKKESITSRRVGLQE